MDDTCIDSVRLCCEEWQTLLRLQDWNVTVHYKNLHDMGNSYLGKVHIHEETKHAEIWLLQPGNEAPLAIPSYDVETTLVHELIHLHFKSFEPKNWKSAKGVAMEQAIDLLSRSLLSLKLKHKENSGGS